MKLKTLHALALGTHVYHKTSRDLCTYEKLDGGRYKIHALAGKDLLSHGMIISEERLIGREGEGLPSVHVVDEQPTPAAEPASRKVATPETLWVGDRVEKATVEHYMYDDMLDLEDFGESEAVKGELGTVTGYSFNNQGVMVDWDKGNGSCIAPRNLYRL